MKGPLRAASKVIERIEVPAIPDLMAIDLTITNFVKQEIHEDREHVPEKYPNEL